MQNSGARLSGQTIRGSCIRALTSSTSSVLDIPKPTLSCLPHVSCPGISQTVLHLRSTTTLPLRVNCSGVLNVARTECTSPPPECTSRDLHCTLTVTYSTVDCKVEKETTQESRHNLGNPVANRRPSRLRCTALVPSFLSFSALCAFSLCGQGGKGVHLEKLRHFITSRSSFRFTFFGFPKLDRRSTPSRGPALMPPSRACPLPELASALPLFSTLPVAARPGPVPIPGPPSLLPRPGSLMAEGSACGPWVP